MLDWYTARITSIEVLNERTWKFSLELLDLDFLDFIPGQFITFDLPIHEKRNKRLRSYSIASSPSKNNEIELVIGNVETGLASAFFFDSTKCNVGTELKFRGALGVFQLPKNLEKHHIFICTGTGIAPFRSMIQHLVSHKIPFNSIDLVFGARRKEDILYKEELEKLAETVPNFKYHVCLSREEYLGYQGYVHERYQAIAAEKPQKEVQFMFCGWRDMIDQARQELSELNYEKEQIVFELYG